jgi:N utilization substance protein B
MKSPSDPRHTSRKLALTSIFCWVFNESDKNDTISLSADLWENQLGVQDTELTSEIVDGVKTHLDAIDKIVEESAPEWPIDKIAKVDLVVLRIAIYELLFGKSTPAKVAVDEAVELAKEFGNDTSHKFVNGVLGTVIEKYLGKKDE